MDILKNLLEGGTTTENSWTTWLIMGLIVVAIIGMFVWQTISSKKKQKEAKEMVESIKIGDKIKTIGGVCGYVFEINAKENTITLETGTDNNKSYVKFDRGAIYQVGHMGEEVVETEEVKEEKVEAVEEAQVTETSEK